MRINGISGAYGSYRVTGRAANKISTAEEALSEPISTKVSSALSNEYIERIKTQARTDAAKGSYMDGYDKKQRTGFSAMRDAQMRQYVSPNRSKAISKVSEIGRAHV